MCLGGSFHVKKNIFLKKSSSMSKSSAMEIELSIQSG